MINNKILRPNFFYGQRLTAEEFKLNQEYHSTMRYRQNSALHSYGIVRGLDVEKKSNLEINVTKGMALAQFYNSAGELLSREIVLIEDFVKSLDKLDFEIPENIETLKVKVIISFREIKNKEEDDTKDESDTNINYKGVEYIQIKENPIIEIVKEDNEINTAEHIVLAVVVLKITNGKPESIIEDGIIKSSVYNYPYFPEELLSDIKFWIKASKGITFVSSSDTNVSSWKNNVQMDSNGIITLDSSNKKILYNPDSLNHFPVVTLNCKPLLDEKNIVDYKDVMVGKYIGSDSATIVVQEIFLVCMLDSDANPEAVLLNLIKTDTSGATIEQYMVRSTTLLTKRRYSNVDESPSSSNKVIKDFSHLGTFDINGETGSDSVPTGKWHIYHAVAKTTDNYKIEINKIILGAQNESIENPWKGSIAEVILFSKAQDTYYRETLMSYLKIKYSIANLDIRPLSAFKSQAGICNRLDFNISGNTGKSLPYIENSSNNKLHICAEKVYFSGYDDHKKADVDINGSVNITGNITVQGNLFISAEAVETNIFTNDLLINDSIITVNKSTEPKKEAGIEIYRGVNNDKPYIKWNDNDSAQTWEAWDLTSNGKGAIALNMPGNLKDGTNADNRHFHSELYTADNQNRALTVNENSVHIGDCSNLNSSNEDALVVNGSIQTQGIVFKDDPHYFPLTSAVQQFDDHTKIYSVVVKAIGTPQTDTDTLQSKIQDNTSIVIIGKDGVFTLSNTISINKKNVKIFCAPNTKIKGTDFSAFSINDTSNVELHNIYLIECSSLADISGTVSGLKIQGCRTDSSSSRLLHHFNACTLKNSIIKNNIWTSNAAKIISFDSAVLKDCIIEENYFTNNLVSDDSYPVVTFSQLTADNLSIRNNQIKGAMPGISLALTGNSSSIDISHNSLELLKNAAIDYMQGISLYAGSGITTEMVKVYGNSVNMNPGSIYNRGIALNQISDALLNDNTVIFNGSNAIGIEALGGSNIIAANNVFEGIKNLTAQNLLDDNNIAFSVNFNFYLQVKIVQNDNFALTTAHVKIWSNEQNQTNILLIDKNITLADYQDEKVQLIIPDGFTRYRVEVTKDSFVHTEDFIKGNYSTTPLDIKFYNTFSFQMKASVRENDILVPTTAQLQISGDLYNVPLISQGIIAGTNDIVLHDGFSSGYRIIIEKSGYDTHTKKYMKNELENQSLEIELIKKFQFQIVVYVVLSEVPTDSYHITISAESDNKILFNDNITTNPHTFSINDGYSHYILDISKDGYQSDKKSYTNEELKGYLNSPWIIVLQRPTP